MAKQAERLWEGVLDDLTAMAAGDKSRTAASVEERLQKIKSSPQQPKAAWKQLVQVMQLPRKLGLFASSKLVQDPYTTSPLLSALLSAVETLLCAAERDCAPQVRLGVLRAILQQLTDSGLFKAFDQLREATALQLEQDATAAATGPPGDGALATLQCNAARLLLCQVRLDLVTHRDDGSLDQSMFGSSNSDSPAGTRLLCASLRHVSSMLPLYQQQGQPEPPPAVVQLVDRISHSVKSICIKIVDLGRGLGASGKQTPVAAAADVARAGEPHSVVWASISLLVLTYASTFKQQSQLPAMGTSLHASSSSGGSSGRKSSSGRAAVAAVAASSGNTLDVNSECFKKAQAAWQQAQIQGQHVPATHKQLLGLFGVSSQAAAWVAAILAHRALPDLMSCWESIPHLLPASLKNGDSSSASTPAGAQPQPQPHPWADKRLLELLPPVLLYGAMHAAPVDDVWSLHCTRAAFVFGRLHTAAAASGTINTGGSSSAQPPAVDTAAEWAAMRVDMLLLTSMLLQRLQQLRNAVAGASSSGSSHSCGVRVAADEPPDVAAELGIVQSFSIGRLLLVEGELRLALGCKAHKCTCCRSAMLSSSNNAACEAAAELHVVWQQQAATICRVCEGFVRSGSAALPAEMHRSSVDYGAQIACLCAEGDSLLFKQAGGGSKQRLAFFRLLLSLLKRPAGGASHASDLVTNVVAEGACSMLKDASAAAAAAVVGVGVSSSGLSSDGFASLWLLVISRCCLQWAVALQQVQAQGVSCVQVMQQARQEVLAGPVMLGTGAGAVKVSPWLIEGRASRLNLPEQQAVVTDLVGLLAEGSGLIAGLSAAGMMCA